MRKRTRIIISTAVSVILILHLGFLCWLFPEINIGGLFSIPFMFLLSVASGIVLFILCKMITKKVFVGLIITGMFISIMLIQVLLHPVETRIFTQLSLYIEAYQDYPGETEYADLAFGNSQIQAAAMVKYHDNLPERIASICISTSSDILCKSGDKYYIFYKDGEVQTDTSRLVVEESGDQMILHTEPGQSTERSITFDMSLDELVRHDLGYSGIFPSDGYIIHFSQTNIEDYTLTGAQQVFSFWLKQFK